MPNCLTGIETIDNYHDRFGIAHIVELHDHDPIWSEIFTLEQTRLAQKLPGEASTHHVGSTSIDWLCAKPIIDMLITYPDEVEFEEIKKWLIGCGYIFREDLLPGRVYFVLENSEGVRYFSISVYPESDPRSEGILTFKENLLKNPELIAEYAHLKAWLSNDWVDRADYMRLKANFVNQYSQRTNNILEP